jgi:Ca2+-binding EF-hand superfamily protein
MTATFDKLKAALQEKGTLTEEEIVQAVKEHGAMTAEENMQLSAEIFERQRASEKKVTMEQFLEANKVLDSADPNSEDYKKAQQIVDAFLAGN